jgi:hypothetical protein
VHITLRYHIATIIGILCSLVLGILIGGALFQDDRLVKEQGLMIEELEGQFAELKHALGELTERERTVNQGWDMVNGTLVGGLLQGEVVLLVSGPPEVNWAPIKGLLEAAGAQCRSVDWQGFGEAEILPGTLVVMWLGSELASPETAAHLQELVDRGAHLAFLQGLKEKHSFPPIRALCIDMADTFLGELALVFGLAGRAAGHYGIKAGAISIIPEVAAGS